MKRLLTFILLALSLLCWAKAAFAQTPITPEQFLPFIQHWEGSTTTPLCRQGICVVGVGHRLNRTSVKLRYTPEELHAFYLADFAAAVKIARNAVWGFDNLPLDAQQVTLSLIWSVGPTGFTTFASYREALSQHLYSLAAYELLSSKWATQVSMERRTVHYTLLENLGGT